MSSYNRIFTVRVVVVGNRERLNGNYYCLVSIKCSRLRGKNVW